MDLNDIKKNLLTFDYVLLGLVCALSIFGIIIIGSATNIHTNPNSPLQSLQIQSFLTGLILLFIFSCIDYKFISKFYWFIYVLNIILLVAVLVIGDTMTSGVTRQLSIGPIGLQPSQFSKVFMIIFLSKFIDKKNENINNITTLILLAVIIFFPILLIQRQPSLSASLVVGFVCLVILFVGGISYKYIFMTVSITLPIAVLGAMDIMRDNHIFVHRIFNGYQINRIKLMLAPDTTSQLFFQTNQSVHALGSGQLTGKGLHNGTINQLNYLPESHNDFIFAVIGEEFGFVGASIVLIVIFLIITKCILIANKANSFTARLMASGVAAMIFFQAFVHVGVVTNLLPNTGIALPFVSYGGSSMWANMIAIGIVMNIHNSNSKFIFKG